MPELDERWTVSRWNRWVCHEGAVYLSANESCPDWEDNLWNPSGWGCATDGPISAQLVRNRDTSGFRFHWQSSWTTQIHKIVCAPFSLQPNRHIRMFPKSFVGSSYLSGKEFTGGVKGMKLVREKQNFTVDGMNPRFIIEADQSQLFLLVSGTAGDGFCIEYKTQWKLLLIICFKTDEQDLNPTDVQG